MIKWEKKLAIKRKAREKEEKEKKYRNRFAKEKRNLAYAHARQ